MNGVPLLSVVIPVYNERENLAALLERCRAVLDACGLTYELVVVDDGSRDGSAARLAAAAAQWPALRVVTLSRNFGHQAALIAGLRHARGRVVVTLDGDLQHPPELIPRLLDEWRAGAEIVQAVRAEPADARGYKRFGSRLFYRLLRRATGLDLPAGAADFRLMTRPAVDALLACPERCRFNRGLVRWIGFEVREVPYRAAPRHAGQSKYSLRDMLRLAGDAIFGFSTWPLRVAGLCGAAVSAGAMLYLVYVLWARLFTARTVPGWSSILAAVLVLGGVQLLVLWVMGEYVGRLYEEVKQRPLYIVRSVTPGEPGDSPAASADRGGPASASVRQDLPAGPGGGRAV